jgi:hypothetical protein
MNLMPKLKKPITSGGLLHTEFDEPSTMAYLHGDVVDDEFEAACDYEYARESHVLRAAALAVAKLPGELAGQWRAEFQKTIEQLEEEEAVRFRDIQEGNQVRPWDVERNRGDVFASLTAEDEAALLRKGRALSFEEICQQIDEDFLCGGLFLQSPWFEFFTQAHFLDTPWNSLTQEDRRGILETLPLPFGKGVLRSIEARSALALRTRPGSSSGQHDLVVFMLDRAKGKKALVREFAAWLDRPENRQALAKFSNKRTGKTGGHADRLKDLGAWRLFEHCERDWNKANDFANEHRKAFEKPEVKVIGSGKNRKRVIFKEGDPKPFHDPRRGQQEKHQLNEASLYSEESGFLKARSRAQVYLRTRMPWEFFKENEEKEFEEMRARWGAIEPRSKLAAPGEK